jgi:hypothetical protein
MNSFLKKFKFHLNEKYLNNIACILNSLQLKKNEMQIEKEGIENLLVNYRVAKKFKKINK